MTNGLLTLQLYTVLIAFWLMPALSHADPFQDADLFGAGPGFFSTSDDYHHFEYLADYRNHRRDFHWPYQEAKTHATDWGINSVAHSGAMGPETFRALAVSGSLGKRSASGHYLEGRLGVHGLGGDTSTGEISTEERIIPTYGIKGILMLNEQVELGLDAGYGFVYPAGFQPEGITSGLTAHTLESTLSWLIIPRLQLSGQSALKRLSDANTMYQGDFSILYGLSPDWPWIWAGVGAYYTGFERQTIEYWSPSRHVSYGPRFTSSFPLGKRWSGWAAANVSVVSEDSLSSGMGDYVSLGLDYQLSRGTRIKLGFNRLDSVHDRAHYYENSVYLSLHRPLF